MPDVRRSVTAAPTGRKELITMQTQVVNATEYRNVSLALLSESKSNPRRIFEDDALRELPASIRSQGVLSPLLVRPLTEHGFEIVAGARRYRAAVPVRLMKRDLLFIGSQLAELVGEGRLEAIAKQHGIERSKDTENIGKRFAAYLRRADEGTLSRSVVELTIVLTASRGNASSILKEAATAYKVDTDTIAQKVKAEFAAKAKAKNHPKRSQRRSRRLHDRFERGREPAASLHPALFARQGAGVAVT
jgi:ParB/RepB/Spo0J family partition protein